MSEMFVASLQNRIRAINILWQRAVSDMTLEHVNHHERAGVLPIAFSLSHYMRAQDQSISGAVPARRRRSGSPGGWAEKVGVTVDRLGREESVEEMENIRFADFDAWRAYQTAVIERTNGVLDTLNEAVLRKYCCRSSRRTCSTSSAPSSSDPALRYASSTSSSASSTSTASATWARSSTAARWSAYAA